MNIGIICATKEEISPFLLQDGIQKIHNELFNCYTFKIHNNKIFICESGIGKINATLATAKLIGEYACTSILFSGVGGGLAENLNPGDLSIANRITQHDIDVTEFGYKHGETPGNEKIVTDNTLKRSIILFSKTKNIPIKELNYTTGDQFIHSKIKKNWIRKTFKADLIDMESYAIAVTCNRLTIPFAIIRSVSDKADDSAKKDFNSAINTSSRISADFILTYLE
jgi:adenosylhomocysteine/aminodeoxyfutalosine nucleosidase